MAMLLSERQHLFALNLAHLIQEIESLNLSCSIGEVYRTKEQAEIYAKEGKGIINSQHCKKLAADIFIFSNGKYLQDKNDYAPLGKYWESLYPENRWGGNFPRADYVHFEMKG